MRQSKGDGNCAKVSSGERYRGLHHRLVIETSLKLALELNTCVA
jgi:hypothetical protein